jgi:hypothetical protein
MSMQHIELEISSDLFEKVISYLEKLPKQKVRIKIDNSDKTPIKRESLVEFFQSSPLVGLDLTRSKESYRSRVEI